VWFAIERWFANWWVKTICKVKECGKGATNSLIILTARRIQKHHNDCMFDGITLSVNEVLRQFREEYQHWGLARAKKLQDLKLHGIGIFTR
jgi:hypothetical protein